MALTLVLTGCAAAQPLSAVMLRPEVLGELSHDPTAWTQGLEISGGVLYEGTGQVGRSQLRELDLATGELRRATQLPDGLYGEGIAVVDDRIWQLTWRDGVALEWDRATLRLLRQVPIDGEGWGLCREGDRLVRSDGTARLRFHDPSTFTEVGSVAVTLDGEPVSALNELDCVAGQVWANVFQTDRLVRIDPADGRVTAVVDATGLLDGPRRADANVLNGIAAAGGEEFVLTGKYWPAMFRVRFVPQALTRTRTRARISLHDGRRCVRMAGWRTPVPPNLAGGLARGGDAGSRSMAVPPETAGPTIPSRRRRTSRGGATRGTTTRTTTPPRIAAQHRHHSTRHYPTRNHPTRRHLPHLRPSRAHPPPPPTRNQACECRANSPSPGWPRCAAGSSPRTGSGRSAVPPPPTVRTAPGSPR